MTERDRRLLLGACCVAAFALALRLGPLYWSPLPFNPDGIIYATRVRDVLATGSFRLDGMATDAIGFTGFLAVVTALGGGEVLTTAQPASAAVGASTVLVAVAFAARLARSLGWTRPRVRAAALLAGLALSLEGIYLYRSMPTDEQTAGLLLVPLVAYAVDRWLATERAAWGAVAVLLLVPLPPLHNLSGLVAVVAVAVVATLATVRAEEAVTVGRAVGAALLTAGYVFGFHLVLAETTGARIVQAGRLVRAFDLFLACVVLVLVGTAWYVTTTTRLQRGIAVSIPLGGLAVVAVNALQPVFPATTATPRPLLRLLAPLAVPAVLAGLAVHVAARDRTVGPTTLALVAGPLAVVATALTARLTFEYLAMLFRAQLFVHLPILVLAAVGAVAVGARSTADGARSRSRSGTSADLHGTSADRPAADGGLRKRRGWLAAVVVLVLVASVAASAPVAYAGLDVLNFQATTTETEFGATEFAAAEFDAWASDDHLVRVDAYHGGGGSAGPTLRWLRGSGPPPSCAVVAQHSWTTTGAQFYPGPPVELAPDRYERWRASSDVVYATTSADPVSVVVPRDATGDGCRP